MIKNPNSHNDNLIQDWTLKICYNKYMYVIKTIIYIFIYGVAVIQWITSCHKNRYITLSHVT